MSDPFEYVVVGSGAGGGTLAARLAEQGHKVLLLEAGGDPFEMQGDNPNTPGKNSLPEDYQVPAFHALASENEAMSWDFFVRHYSDTELQKKDPHYRTEWNGQPVDGVFYPRGGTLGGCTAHNAMITVYPHNEDWENIQKITGDASWSPKSMRRYFQRLENCHHRPLMRFLYKLFRYNPARHGYKGWLQTEISIPEDAVAHDEKLVDVLVKTTRAEADNINGNVLQRAYWWLVGRGDPNDWRLVRDNAIGVRFLPLATRNHARTGSRERVLEVMQKYPDRLKVELNALATRVLFDDDNRAIGVEYLKGGRLYRAHRNANRAPGKREEAHASREVILAGGAYNTPQLMMLSGLGPRAHLEELGIKVRVDLPGVGQNLQDRYEMGVVNRMNFPEWWVLKDAKFAKGDAQYEDWATKRGGVYSTNGVISAVFLKSFPDRPLPDLFCFAILGRFHGYYPGYSAEFAKHRNYLTWAILKAHTNNTAGEVRLRTNDPRDTPYINFRYFGEGNDTREQDLDAVVEGVKFVRRLARPLIEKGICAEEESPGAKIQTDEEIREHVRTHAWGHHAAGTCKIDKRENGGVVNGDFEVYGTKNLRIVDASVFPRIPGFFIVSSVYTIGEKAADVISRKARSSS